ncbi:MAG TPA: hypothetical protein VG755_34600 [Nannocystaceae bacterium]|nr:hypothetical protein [Nannocystaceae bacterium]
MPSVRALSLLVLLAPTAAIAADSAGYHPYAPARGKVRTVDMSAAAIAARSGTTTTAAHADMSVLDRIVKGEVAADPDGENEKLPLPEGMVQRGTMVLPSAIDDGSLQVEPDTIFAITDIPGNEYPRKHTLYLNFTGGELSNGSDNSAENKSTLARQGNYPAWTQGETKAVAAAQGVAADFAPFGITVVYETRPEQTLPYTMAMMGGDWTDTNIESPAGGVAPGADCGALGQRHVVYAFETSSTIQMANVASQEAGHSYGLDHTFNCASVMSYCAGGDGSFQEDCAGLCESQCQGPNSAGCQLTHEMFCGEGSLQQSDAQEMAWIFGGNEPDMEPPTAEILSPEDGAELEMGASVDFRAAVDDNYGGYGWKFLFYKDGEVALDQVDYDREVDDEFHPALNLTNLDVGVYELHIQVVDHFGHMTEDVATIYVGGATTSGPVDTSASASATDGETSDTSNVDGTGTDEDGSGSDAGTTPGQDDGGTADRGCTCDAGASTNGGLFALVGVIAFARRRRTR